MSKVILRKYGEATTIPFSLFEIDGINFKVDAVYVSGDVNLMKDEGAENPVSSGFTDEGQGNAQPLSATEMEFARGVLYIVDQGTKAWLDTNITIETYGHASAQHPNKGIAMRGTDSAALASALTTHDGKLDIVDTVVDGIQTDLSNSTDGLGALKTLIDAVQLDLDNPDQYKADITALALEATVAALNNISVADIEASSVIAKEATLDGLISDMILAMGLSLHNHVEDDVVRDGSKNKTSSVIYLYDSATNVALHDKSTGLIKKYNAAATYVDGVMTRCKFSEV